MKVRDPIERAKAKALKSVCRFKIAAIGEDDKGTVIDITVNAPRFLKKSGGRHAEMLLMHRNPKSLAKIYILRINNSGKLLPISPCKSCQKKADKLGIKIISVTA
jgi:hypothetical protein